MNNSKKVKEEKILNAAMDLFQKNGYSATKMSDIARRCGVAKGTLYQYFDSKESLFTKLIDTYIMEDFSKASAIVSASNMSAAEKLRAFISFEIACTARYGSNISAFETLLFGSNNATSGALLTAVRNVQVSQFTVLREILIEGMDRGEFRQMNPSFCSAYILGSLNFLIQEKFGEFSVINSDISEDPEGEKFMSDNRCEDELFSLIISGINA